MAAQGGQNTFRFSIAWDRILPDGRGDVNPKGIDFYNRVIDCCLKEGIEPNVTLFHYDLPQAMAEEGGWERREITDDFAEYAKVCFSAFGDRVKLWATINELKYYSYCTNIVGNYPPNHHLDFDRYFKTIYHEVLASAKAVKIYHDMHMSGSIGVVHDSSNVEIEPHTKDPAKVKKIADLFYNSLVLDTSIFGKLPEDLVPFLKENNIENDYIMSSDADIFMAGKVDWVGMNVYNRMYLTDYSSGESQVFHNNKGSGSSVKEGIRLKNWFETSFDPTAKRNLWGREIYPECMYHTLMEIKERYGNIPVYITENGHGEYETADANDYVEDDDRIEMMQGYINYMLKAKKDGANVLGYYAWSPMDLYSWVNGYEKRYGLVYVNFETQKRTPKKSYYWFKKLIEKYQKENEQ
jgi:6-phospho-beta-glucosidase